MRKIYVSSVTGAIVRYNADWQEFVVIPSGVTASSDKCYHTSDKQDAIATADMMEAAV